MQPATVLEGCSPSCPRRAKGRQAGAGAEGVGQDTVDSCGHAEPDWRAWPRRLTHEARPRLPTVLQPRQPWSRFPSIRPSSAPHSTDGTAYSDVSHRRGPAPRRWIACGTGSSLIQQRERVLDLSEEFCIGACSMRLVPNMPTRGLGSGNLAAAIGTFCFRATIQSKGSWNATSWRR